MSPTAGHTAASIACEALWPGEGHVQRRVVIALDTHHIASVEPDSEHFDGVARDGLHLPGLTVPGLVNAHSHAFHRALRGRTHGGRGDFWSWRQQMYALAGTLDPDRYYALAVGVYGEMAQAGITCVGEFHYLHHQPDGARYADPNAMGHALIAAAAHVGIRITLLDALYLTADVGRTLEDPGLDPVQARFTDGSADAWLSRLGALADDRSTTSQVGGALHSIRAVPAASAARAVEGLAGLTDGHGARPVLHAHVAEQPAEVFRSREVHDRTPVALLADAGAIDARFTAVHGVWLDDMDITTLGRAGATVCACPTTERDLADGVVPADRLLAAGASLSLGSDQHAVIDLLEEARAVELNLRLATQVRGAVPAEALLRAVTAGGAASLGWPDCGRLAVGAPADLTTIGWTSSRLAGVPMDLAGAVFAATADDVTHTMVDGKLIVAGGRHATIDVPAVLTRAIGDLQEAHA